LNAEELSFSSVKKRLLVTSPATVTASAQIDWFCAFEVSLYGQKERRNTVSSAALQNPLWRLFLVDDKKRFWRSERL
jgi:hypothetical protein